MLKKSLCCSVIALGSIFLLNRFPSVVLDFYDP